MRRNPTMLTAAESLGVVRLKLQTKQPAKGGGKALLSPTVTAMAWAEAEAKAGAAEAELLAMVELEEAAAGSGAVRPAKGNMGKRGRLRRCAWLSGGGMNCGRFGDASGQT